MAYDNERVAQMLRRWETYLGQYRLPAWNEIPDLGLYMEQVTDLLNEYLNVPETVDGREAFISASTINNYVRKKVMPKPIKKKYYRHHIAYLIIIYTLKYCLSIPTIQIMLPSDRPAEEMERVYTDYVARYHAAVDLFGSHVRAAEAALLESGAAPEPGSDPQAFITTVAVLGGLSRMLAEKLILFGDGTRKAGAEATDE